MPRKPTARPQSQNAQDQTTINTVYDRIRRILESARSNVARTVNSTQVIANWLIGHEIVEGEQHGSKRAQYGKQLIEGLAARLKANYGTGHSAQNLFYMKQFYLSYPSLLPASKILHALRGESSSVYPASANILHPSRGKSAWQPGMLHTSLSWTHYRTLLRVDSANARAFYEIEAINNNWAARELERQINSLLFERLARSRDKQGVMKLAKRGQSVSTAVDVFKDPVVIEFLGLPESPRLAESDLEQSLISNLQSFLLELGKGFAFVSRQERITLDGDHFYIDLVFYHTILKCYILIDLKVGKLTHGDLGQIQLYVNYFDHERREDDDNPTLGLILCTDKNDAVVRYTLGAEQSRKIFASRYKLHLPTEQELKIELRRELKQLSVPANQEKNP